jgi:hypothetical protein
MTYRLTATETNPETNALNLSEEAIQSLQENKGVVVIGTGGSGKAEWLASHLQKTPEVVVVEDDETIGFHPTMPPIMPIETTSLAAIDEYPPLVMRSKPTYPKATFIGGGAYHSGVYSTSRAERRRLQREADKKKKKP